MTEPDFDDFGQKDIWSLNEVGEFSRAGNAVDQATVLGTLNTLEQATAIGFKGLLRLKSTSDRLEPALDMLELIEGKFSSIDRMSQLMNDPEFVELATHWEGMTPQSKQNTLAASKS